ncbi:MAG: pseudouridine synthase [Planctomycetota bacterium]|nr:pseudouridine synthase [Planctomycetota bacterium]MDA1105082.1 pseudouridine synthase [Planctomycetota bacterium]
MSIPSANASVPYEVLQERDGIAFVCKPRGVASEPGLGHQRDSLLNGLVARWPALRDLGEERDYGLLHRLDRDTSGVVVVATDPARYDELRAAFADRSVQKRYLAVVQGRLSHPTGTCTTPLQRVRRTDALIVVPDPRGLPATTHWKTIARDGALALLEVSIETGRTHQIRVHLALQGAAVRGDRVYRPLLPPNTSGFKGPSDLRLHAWELSVPLGSRTVTVRAPVPDSFVADLPLSLRSAIENLTTSHAHGTSL